MFRRWHQLFRAPLGFCGYQLSHSVGLPRPVSLCVLSIFSCATFVLSLTPRFSPSPSSGWRPSSCPRFFTTLPSRVRASPLPRTERPGRSRSSSPCRVSGSSSRVSLSPALPPLFSRRGWLIVPFSVHLLRRVEEADRSADRRSDRPLLGSHLGPLLGSGSHGGGASFSALLPSS